MRNDKNIENKNLLIKNEELKRSDTIITEDKVNLDKSLAKNQNFFYDCSGLIDKWVGTIQFTNDKELYMFIDCNSGNEHSFEVLMSLKNKSNDPSEILNKYNLAKDNNNYSEFDCFAFLTVKKINNEPQNEFDVYEFIFPMEVEVLNYKKNNWIKVKNKKINSIKELNELKSLTFKGDFKIKN